MGAHPEGQAERRGGGTLAGGGTPDANPGHLSERAPHALLQSCACGLKTWLLPYARERHGQLCGPGPRASRERTQHA